MLLFSVTSAQAESSGSGMSQPRLVDSKGNILSSGTVGYLVVISTVFVSAERETPFVVFIEVRDENDVTVYLQFAMGTTSYYRTDIGLSWLPEHEGNYKLRTFAITSFSNFVPLTEIMKSEVTIKP